MLSPNETVSAVLRQSHTDEVTEIIDTDEIIRSRFAQFIDFVALCGNTLPSPDPNKHRYSELIDCLSDAFSDGFPASREHGDDPYV